MFLNKQDILQRKIEQGRKLEKYFADYVNFIVTDTKNGQSLDEYNRARLFMAKKLRVRENIYIIRTSRFEVVLKKYSFIC